MRLNPRSWLPIMISLNAVPLILTTVVGFRQTAELISVWGWPNRVDQHPMARPFPKSPITAFPLRVPRSMDRSRDTCPSAIT